MERVLVTGATNIGKAGVATIVYKWGQYFDSDVCVYDYLMQSGVPDDKYVDAIKGKGGRIYTMSGSRGYKQIIDWVTSIIRDNKYRTIHINSDSAYIAAAYIFAAKRGGIENIYVHSHCTQIDDNSHARRLIKTVLHFICRRYVRKNSRLYLACSALAGEWMFGRHIEENPNYMLVCNGVEVEDYLFDEKCRIKYRAELGVEEKTVLGNIGRFSYQKNHEFLINMFAEYYKYNQQSVLILVGTGELYNEMKEKVHNMKLDSCVLFLGQRNDVPKLLSAMDVLVMPSRFEGLPVTMVEAQMASLPCVVSDFITKESSFTDRVDYLELNNYDYWIASIERALLYNRPINKEMLENSNFNIKHASKMLQNVLVGSV